METMTEVEFFADPGPPSPHHKKITGIYPVSPPDPYAIGEHSPSKFLKLECGHTVMAIGSMEHLSARNNFVFCIQCRDKTNASATRT